jgi:hypothetical protein
LNRCKKILIPRTKISFARSFLSLRGNTIYTLSNRFADEVVGGAEVRVCKVPHIRDFFKGVKEYPNPLSEDVIDKSGD